MKTHITLEDRDEFQEKLLEKHGYLHKDEVLRRVKEEWIKQFGDLNKNVGEIEGMGYFVSGFVNSTLNKK